jgi:hypothetical protein
MRQQREPTVSGLGIGSLQECRSTGTRSPATNANAWGYPFRLAAAIGVVDEIPATTKLKTGYQMLQASVHHCSLGWHLKPNKLSRRNQGLILSIFFFEKPE